MRTALISPLILLPAFILDGLSVTAVCEHTTRRHTYRSYNWLPLTVRDLAATVITCRGRRWAKRRAPCLPHELPVLHRTPPPGGPSHYEHARYYLARGIRLLSTLRLYLSSLPIVVSLYLPLPRTARGRACCL